METPGLSMEKPEGRLAVKLPGDIRLDELKAMPADAVQHLKILDEDNGQGKDADEIREQYIAMLVGEREIAFRVADIEAILDMQRITPVPGLPSFVLGICNVRGEITSVVDIRKVLGYESRRMSNKRNAAEKIIIVRGHTYSVGFVVTTVLDVLRVHEREIIQANPEDAEATRAASFATGIYVRAGDELRPSDVILIDTEKLLETKELSQFQ
ncbi:MAG: chemotaxis protein CheW [Rhizobacter sp.]|nr:chemotaxis protein CheW [Chlorobiales bacterium]